MIKVLYENFYYLLYCIQGRSQRGARGARAPLIKSWPPPVGPGRYIQSVQNSKIFNKNTLVHLKDSLASGHRRTVHRGLGGPGPPQFF